MNAVFFYQNKARTSVKSKPMIAPYKIIRLKINLKQLIITLHAFTIPSRLSYSTSCLKLLSVYRVTLFLQVLIKTTNHRQHTLWPRLLHIFMTHLQSATNGPKMKWRKFKSRMKSQKIALAVEEVSYFLVTSVIHSSNIRLSSSKYIALIYTLAIIRLHCTIFFLNTCTFIAWFLLEHLCKVLTRNMMKWWMVRVRSYM